MSQETLKQRYEEFMRLDAQRTQGEWTTSGHGVYSVKELAYIIQSFPINSWPNLCFTAAAPQMIALLKDLWAEREDLINAYKIAREFLASHGKGLEEIKNGLKDIKAISLDAQISNDKGYVHTRYKIGTYETPEQEKFYDKALNKSMETIDDKPNEASE
jgi:hypothetical protein